MTPQDCTAGSEVETALRDDAAASRGGSLDARVPALRRFLWLLRRELWEVPAIYLAPIAVTGFVLIGTGIVAYRLPQRMREVEALHPMLRHEALAQPYLLASLILMFTTFVVAIFYSLDSLHSERKDRSILFWKSLPVSDLETILAKATVPIVLLPLLTVALTMLAHVVMLALGSAALATSGQGAATLWTHLDLSGIWLAILYHMVAIHGLWFAPIYAWLLLASAWSPRMPWLWAALPPVAVGVVEKFAFGTSTFAELLMRRMGNGVEGAEFLSDTVSMDPTMHLDVGRFLASPGLWVGLLVAAALLAEAVRSRRMKGPL